MINGSKRDFWVLHCKQCHLETWSLYNNQLLHMMLLVLFAGWNCSETKPKQNRHFKQVHTTRTQNSKHCWRWQEFTILSNIVILYLSFSNHYRPKSGMVLNSVYEVDQTTGWIIILLKRLPLHIFDKIWNSKLMMTSLLTTRLGRKIHKNSMGKQKKNHATDCCLQVLKTFFIEFSPYR